MSSAINSTSRKICAQLACYRLAGDCCQSSMIAKCVDVAKRTPGIAQVKVHAMGTDLVGTSQSIMQVFQKSLELLGHEKCFLQLSIFNRPDSVDSLEDPVRRVEGAMF